MKQAGTRLLFSYWNRLRGERATPEREDIDPAAIAGLLRDTFILEVDPDRDMPIRVAGAGLSALFTRELKGEKFTALFQNSDQASLKTIIEAVMGDAAPAVVGIAAAPAGRPLLELEMLLLPLRHRAKTHARLLGSLTPSSFPSWLGLLEVTPMNIVSLRIVRPEMAQDYDQPHFFAADVGLLPLPEAGRRRLESRIRLLEIGRPR